MKKIILISGILLTIPLSTLYKTDSIAKAADTPSNVGGLDTTGMSSEQVQALNAYMQNQKAQKDAQAQKQAQGANSNSAANDPAQQNSNVTLSKWAIALIVIYLITLVLVWIALIMSIIALARWLKRN